MEATKSVTVVLALVVLTTAAVCCAQEPPEPVAAATPAAETSNTRTASCLVKITADTAIIGLDEFIIESLLRSSGVAGKAAQKVLGISPDDTSELFTIEDLTHWDSGGSGVGTEGAEERSDDDYYMMEEYKGMMEMETMGTSGGQSRSSSRRSTSRSGSSSARSSGAAGTSRTTRRSTTAPRSTRQTSGSYNYYYRTDGRGSTDPFDGYYSYYGSRPRPATRRTARTTAASATSVDQTLLFRLSVDLPDGTKPAAKEFMDALIDNLKEALGEAHDACFRQLVDEIHRAEEQREEAEDRLSELKDELRQVEAAPAIGDDPADYGVYAQLEEIVDLSALTPSMPFGEAIEVVKNSVEPPLKIVVLWRDLLEETEVEPPTEINMDGVGAVRLGKALELLLKAVSGGAVDELGYAVDKGIITISAAESLPRRLETRIYGIPMLIYSGSGIESLLQLIPLTVEPASWSVGQPVVALFPGQKLAIRQTREVHQEIRKFLEELTKAIEKIDVPVDVPAGLSVEMLLQEKHNLLRSKQALELDVARMEARRAAIEEQVPLISKEADRKIATDPIVAELKRLLDLQTRLLEMTKKLVDTGQASHSELTDAEGKVARAKIELARRREELSKSAGGDQLAKLANDLTALTIELTEKKAELQVLSKQLDQTQKQLTAASTSDPQVSKIRLVTQALEMAERRVNELEARLASLQEPTVTVLGAD